MATVKGKHVAYYRTTFLSPLLILQKELYSTTKQQREDDNRLVLMSLSY